MEDGPLRIGVLSFHESKEAKAILNAIEALGHEAVWLREHNMLLQFENGAFVLEPDVDVVINRLLLSTTEQPVEAVGFAHALARFRPIVNDPDAAAHASHKIAAAAAMVAEGVPIPKTALPFGMHTLGGVRDKFGDQHVYKTTVGTHGGGAWKVHRDDLITGTVGTRRAFLQEFIPPTTNGARDLRVYVVDGAVIGAMYRYAAEGDWRTNVARGGSVQDATDRLPDDVEEIATRATNAVGLDCAGVDLIERDGEWLVLEVNPTAGFRGLFRATGCSPAPHIAALAIERAGGTVSGREIQSLESALDDTPPSCMPESTQLIEPESPVIGIAERVVVSGTTDTKAVIGRADPGSSRSRIDLQLAAAIGAGPIKAGDVRGDGHRQPRVDVVIGIAGIERTVNAVVEDRPSATHPLLLGRDVLGGFQIDVSRRQPTQDSSSG